MTPEAALQERLSRGPAVWALAAGMTLIYGTTFFNYAGLILFWLKDPGWSKTLLASGPMIAMLLSALLAPALGRQVDKGRGPELLTWGPVLASVALVALSRVQEPWQWILCWAVMGLAQGACFYEVGFSFLVRRLGGAARHAIIRVTLVAGFSSTIAFPIYAALGNGPGWRAATLGGALLTLITVVPLNIYATRKLRREAPPPQLRSDTECPAPTAAATARTRKALILLVLTSCGLSLNHWALSSYIMPILISQGYSQGLAVFAAACFGPAQVLARLGLMVSGTRVSNLRAVAVILGLMLVASGALIMASAGVVFGFAYIALQGAAFGAMTILRPVLISDVMGPENYGLNAGKVLLPTLLTAALGPMIGAIVLENFGVTPLILLGAVMLLGGFAALMGLQRNRRSG